MLGVECREEVPVLDLHTLMYPIASARCSFDLIASFLIQVCIKLGFHVFLS